MTSSLSIDVFNSGYKPIPGGPGWDGSTPATWPASTATLISGGGDAVLVDALLTTSEGQRLAAWVQGTGNRPHVIFVTHGHADHFFGAGPVLDAFPDAQLHVSARTRCFEKPEEERHVPEDLVVAHVRRRPK